MNNWTLQAMQEKNAIIKKQAKRITELEIDVERMTNCAELNMRVSSSRVPWIVLYDNCQWNMLDKCGHLFDVTPTPKCTQENCPIIKDGEQE